MAADVTIDDLLQGIEHKFVQRDEFARLTRVAYFTAGVALANTIMSAVILIALLSG